MSYLSASAEHERLKLQETIRGQERHANNLQNWQRNLENKLASADPCRRERILKEIQTYENDYRAVTSSLERLRRMC